MEPNLICPLGTIKCDLQGGLKSNDHSVMSISAQQLWYVPTAQSRPAVPVGSAANGSALRCAKQLRRGMLAACCPGWVSGLRCRAELTIGVASCRVADGIKFSWVTRSDKWLPRNSQEHTPHRLTDTEVGVYLSHYPICLAINSLLSSKDICLCYKLTGCKKS